MNSLKQAKTSVTLFFIYLFFLSYLKNLVNESIIRYESHANKACCTVVVVVFVVVLGFMSSFKMT